MDDTSRLLIDFVRNTYQTKEFVPLHAPVFGCREKKLVMDTVESTFVSSVGEHVVNLEQKLADYTVSPSATATVNGTSALQIALRLVGVRSGDLVITQPVSFVASCNAINYNGAEPVFIDISKRTLGMCPVALDAWLSENAVLGNDGLCVCTQSNQIIRACLPVHTFGHPVDIDGLLEVCKKWHLPMVEDAAEALGSFYKGKHAGTFGAFGSLSFNGNKIITTGGGGMILTDKVNGSKAKHLTTTAKVPHAFEYIHDELGFNYRMPNLNAALGIAQMERIDEFVNKKRILASRYRELLQSSNTSFFSEPSNSRSNYWLNALICENESARNEILQNTNKAGVMTRPLWRLLSLLPMYQHCMRGELENAQWFADRIVNIPSGVPN